MAKRKNPVTTTNSVPPEHRAFLSYLKSDEWQEKLSVARLAREKVLADRASMAGALPEATGAEDKTESAGSPGTASEPQLQSPVDADLPGSELLLDVEFPLEVKALKSAEPADFTAAGPAFSESLSASLQPLSRKAGPSNIARSPTLRVLIAAGLGMAAGLAVAIVLRSPGSPDIVHLVPVPHAGPVSVGEVPYLSADVEDRLGTGTIKRPVILQTLPRWVDSGVAHTPPIISSPDPHTGDSDSSSETPIVLSSGPPPIQSKNLDAKPEAPAGMSDELPSSYFSHGSLPKMHVEPYTGENLGAEMAPPRHVLFSTEYPTMEGESVAAVTEKKLEPVKKEQAHPDPSDGSGQLSLLAEPPGPDDAPLISDQLRVSLAATQKVILHAGSIPATARTQLAAMGVTNATVVSSRFAPAETTVVFYNSDDAVFATELAASLNGRIMDMTHLVPAPADPSVEIYLKG